MQLHNKSVRKLPSRVVRTTKTRFSIPVSRWAQILIGIVFLFAAGAKGLDLTRFGRQIGTIFISLGLDRSPLLTEFAFTAAIIVILIELYISGHLLTGYKSNDMSLVAALILIFFAAIAVWMLVRGEHFDCGCFGIVVARTAREMLTDDLILAFLAIVGANSKYIAPAKKTSGQIIFIIGTLWVTLFYFVSLPGNALHKGSRISKTVLVELGAKPDAKYIWLFNPDCPTCQDITPLINNIYLSSEAKLYGIAPTSGGKVPEFQYDFKPFFPISEIPLEAYQSLGVLDGSLMKFKNGKVIDFWPPNVLKNIDNPRVRQL